MARAAGWTGLDSSSRLLVDITAGRDTAWRRPLGRELAAAAHRHGLLGLLVTHEREQLRQPVLAPYGRLKARQEIMVAHLRRLLERLADASVPATVVKGPFLAHHVYGDPRHRTYTDIDLVVPRGQVDRALDVLSTDAAVTSIPRKRPRADKRDVPLRDDSGMWFMVDLHWDLFSYTQLQGAASGATDWAWEHASPSETPFGPIMVFPDEIRIAFSCTHALLDHRFRLILFRDLAEMARRGVDWGSLAEATQRWSMRSFTYLALLIAARVADADVPDEVLAELRPRSAPIRAAEYLLPRTDLVRFDGHRPHPLNLAMVLLHDDPKVQTRLLAHAPVGFPAWRRRVGWLPTRRRRPPSSGDPKASRILTVVTSNRRRGAQVFAERLTVGLEGAGWTTDLVALAGSRDQRRIDADVLVSRPAGTTGRLDLAVVAALRRRIRRFEPDVVFANGAATLRYTVAATRAMRRRPKVVYASIGEPTYWIRGRRHRWVQRLLHDRVDRVAAVSEETRRQLVAFVGLDPDRVVVAHTGVPDVFFSIEPSPPDGHFRVLFLGNLSAEKDPHAGLGVLEALPGSVPARLRYVGSGPLQDELRAAVQRSDLEEAVDFTGSVSDVTPHLAWADVLLLPSQTEGLPGAVLEAAAAGVPSVAFDVGGTSETIVDGVTGRLLPAGDIAGLARELARLDGDRDALREMGRAGRSMVRARFSMPAAVARFDEVFTAVLPAARRRRSQRLPEGADA